MPAPAREALIRPLTGADIGGWIAAIGAVAAERRWLATTEARPEALRRFAETGLDRGHPPVLALAGSGAADPAEPAEVVGWCDIAPIGHGARAHVGGLGMGLLEGWRGRGIGTRLLAATLAQAEAAGFGRIELKVRASNLAAIRLYEAAGFAREGVLRRAWLLDGAADDLIAMGRLFGDAQA